MHVMALLAQGAGVLKYMLPVSHLSCVVAYRVMVALLLCYDVIFFFHAVLYHRFPPCV